ncbi:MAG: M56 family metallopeptidase, partial [Sedimentisphaerales bacterium]|nr:M56 family metallopeptidase [Sedimentisphaerales bacterium]
MHELGHVLRLDPFVNLLQVLAQGLFWFHPLVWLANGRIRAEREKCCDEFAIAKLRLGPHRYCSAIVDVLMAQHTSRRAVPTLAVAGPVKNIEDRIKTALTPGRRFAARPAWRAILAITLLAAIIVPTTVALSSRPGERVEVEKVSDIQEIKSYIAILSDGTPVELLAVCEHPSDAGPWWRPDGSTYEGEKTDKFDFGDALVPKEDEFVRLLLVRSPYWPKNQTYADYKVDGCNGSGFFPRWQKDSDILDSTQAFNTKFKDSVSSTSLTLGFGVGEWKFVAGGSNGKTGATTLDNIFDRSVIYEEAQEHNGTIHLKAYHRLDKEYECRLVARDKDKKEYAPVRCFNLDNDIRCCTAVFDIKLDDVKMFFLQARKREYVAFKGISLRPGEITDVKVANSLDNELSPLTEPATNPFRPPYSSNRHTAATLSKGKSYADVIIDAQVDKTWTAKLPNGATVELLALFGGKSKDALTFWRPDGSMIDNHADYMNYLIKFDPSLIRNQPEGWQFEYGYLYRIVPLDNLCCNTGVSVGWHNLESYPHLPINHGVGKDIVESRPDDRNKGFPSIGEIRIQAGCGPWRTITAQNNRIDGLYEHAYVASTVDDGSIIVSGIRKFDDDPVYKSMVDVIVNSGDIGVGVLTYIQVDGREKKAESYGTRGGPMFADDPTINKTMLKYRFVLEDAPEDVKGVTVQYQPMQMAVFKNVALKPNLTQGETFGVHTNRSMPPSSLMSSDSNSKEITAIPQQVQDVLGVISGLIDGALAQDHEAIRSLLGEAQPNTKRYIEEFRELFEVNDTWKPALIAVHWTDDECRAVSNPLPVGDPKVGSPQMMLFSLHRQENRWLVYDIDLEALAGLQIENSRFLQKHPGAHAWYDETGLPLILPRSQTMLEQRKPKSKKVSSGSNSKAEPVVLVVGCPLDTEAKREVAQVVGTYYQARWDRDIETLMQCQYFESDAQRERCWQILMEEIDNYPQYSHPVHLYEIQEQENNTYSVSTLICTQNTYFCYPPLSVVVQNGEYKMQFYIPENDEQKQIVQKYGVKEAARRSLQKSLQEIQAYQGKDLAELKKGTIDHLESMLMACQYAREHKLNYNFGQDEEEMKQKLAYYRDASPEDIRDEMVKGFKEELEKPDN